MKWVGVSVRANIAGETVKAERIGVRVLPVISDVEQF